MKQQLLDDLLAFLREPPDPSSGAWCDYRDSLIEDFQAERAALVYKPRTTYRLERWYVSEKWDYIDGTWKTSSYPCRINLPACPCTASVKKMRTNVRVMLEMYPLEELRLYYGSRRIRDIAAWLEEEQ